MVGVLDCVIMEVGCYAVGLGIYICNCVFEVSVSLLFTAKP